MNLASKIWQNISGWPASLTLLVSEEAVDFSHMVWQWGEKKILNLVLNSGMCKISPCIQYSELKVGAEERK